MANRANGKRNVVMLPPRDCLKSSEDTDDGFGRRWFALLGLKMARLRGVDADLGFETVKEQSNGCQK